MHPNGELIRSGFEAFAKGDMDTVGALFDDDLVWHSAGTSVLAGDYGAGGTKRSRMFVVTR